MKFPFDKIFCIHLAEAKDRYEHINNTIREFGIEDQIEIWWTCKKPLVNNKIGNNMDGLKDNYYNAVYKFNKNVYGNVFDCAYNHYCIVKQAYIRGLNSILIIEDDIMFNSNQEKIQEIFNKMPQEYDIIKFYNTYNANSEQNKIKDLCFINKSNAAFYKYVLSTLCYALSRKGMELVINEYEKNFGASDVILERIQMNNYINDKFFVLTYNALCMPINDKSNIVYK